MAITTLTDAELKALPRELREKMLSIQNTATTLAKAGEGNITLHVGEKGGISVRGFGRFPTTLYSDQWDRFFAWLDSGGRDTFAKFQEANRDKLKTKVQAAVDAVNGNGNGNGSK
jgi:hypothetical protein